jgi:ArsR family transcriptional regulator
MYRYLSIRIDWEAASVAKPMSTAIDVAAQPACCTWMLAEPLDEDRAAELAKGFSALADPVRLRVLNLIAGAPNGEVCVCEFVEPLGKSQPTVSHHLKVLSDAGLIEGERRSKWVWYRLVPERLAGLRETLATSPA